MSKKKNKKFQSKKKNKNPISQKKIARINPVSNVGDIDSVSDDSIDELELDEDEIEEPDVYETDKYEHVRKDIKKIVLIMTILILILFGTYFLSLKSPIFVNISNWIYEILNIQTG